MSTGTILKLADGRVVSVDEDFGDGVSADIIMSANQPHVFVGFVELSVAEIAGATVIS